MHSMIKVSFSLKCYYIISSIHLSPYLIFIFLYYYLDGSGFCHEELALGYANRSAVLFQMKEYELCIRDITRAFDNSYPNNLMYKLFERKARCLKALKEYPRALESMKSAEMWMKYSTLNETKSSSFKKDVSKQIEFLDEKVAAMSISEFANACDHRYYYID